MTLRPAPLILCSGLVTLLALGVLSGHMRLRTTSDTETLTLRLHALPLAQGRLGELLLSNRAMAPVTVRLSSAVLTPAYIGGWTNPPRWEVACLREVTVDPWQTLPVCFVDPTTTATAADSRPVATWGAAARARITAWWPTAPTASARGDVTSGDAAAPARVSAWWARATTAVAAGSAASAAGVATTP